MRNFIRILGSANFPIGIRVIHSIRMLWSSKNFMSSELLYSKAGHQNSDWNPWRISQEFCGHLILDKNSDKKYFHDFLKLPKPSNFLIIRLHIFKMNQQNYISIPCSSNCLIRYLVKLFLSIFGISNLIRIQWSSNYLIRI